MAIPVYIKQLFWDADKVSIKSHSGYIIRRILNYGNPLSIKWLKNTFQDSQIKEIVKKSRDLTRRTAFFWAHYYKIPLGSIECLRKYYPRNLRPF